MDKGRNRGHYGTIRNKREIKKEEIRLEQAERIKNLPPYLFVRIDQKVKALKEKGADIISLGMGDPDLPPPDYVIEALTTAAHEPKNLHYPTSIGLLEFRKAVSDWYNERFGVRFDPEKEIVSLIGSKEGLYYASASYINPGDIGLAPDPGYPVYGIGIALSGGSPYYMPLKEENNFLPNYKDIPEDILKKAKLLFINYPNNPTSAIAPREFFEETIELGKKYNILICHDNSYSEISLDENYTPLSIFQIPGARDIAIEFHSVSKTFNMTGFRIGWVLGREDVVQAIGKIKSNIDSGIFEPIQYAAIAALKGPKDHNNKMKKIYRERRDLIIKWLRKLGWDIEPPKATIYVWAKVPKGFTSMEFSELLLEKAHVIVTPGNGYGPSGEGYIRIALTATCERIEEAFKRIEEALKYVDIRF